MTRRYSKAAGLFVSFVCLFFSGQMLFAQLADGHSKFLGNIMQSSWWGNTVITSDFGQYWNQVSPENAGKWGVVEGRMGSYSWKDLDLIYRYSRENNIPFRQHVMVWGGQQPEWMKGLSAEKQLAKLEEWFTHIATRYPDTEIVEVINEQLPKHSPELHYIEAIGGRRNGASNAFLAANEDKYGPYGTGWDYVIWAFAKAREYFPNAVLHINDYNILNNLNHLYQYLDIIKILKDRGLIDAVGLQSHFFSVDNLTAFIIKNRLDMIQQETGLPIYITELDITGGDDDDENLQKERFATVFPALWEHPAVAGVTLWGYKVGHNWAENKKNKRTSGLIRKDGTYRPAMDWLISYFETVDPNLPTPAIGREK